MGGLYHGSRSACCLGFRRDGHPQGTSFPTAFTRQDRSSCITQTKVKFFAPLFTCAPQNNKAYAPNMIYPFIYDVACLGIMIFYLMRYAVTQPNELACS